ncbi:helix-turn-helix transcriptional regulator [Nocardia asteroides]|uniref:helix-turn-helix transcriptional regulator n=1 Tax=Nocardia asteroides TaxID=1824 RepID=UPI003661D212
MLDRAFVGRTAELAALTTTFTGPDAPWVLLVEGPAGIGKSRLVARFAESVPCRVFSVTGAEDARAQPGYLTDDLVEQLDDGGADPWAGTVGAGTAVLGDLGCEERQGTDLVADAPPSSVEDLRGGVGATDVLADGAVARRLRRALGVVQTVLIVDDAQWADAESVRLLAFLIRNRPANGFRLLLAFRDGGCPPAITRLLRGPRVRATHVRVPPFTEADVAGLLPGEEPRRRARLLTASRGNPLYLALLADLPDRELDRALRGENPDPTSNGYAALDRTIRAELAQLPDLERAVAQATAVCGAPPDLELLCAAADLPLPTVADALDGLDARGVVRLTEGAVTFVHPLIRTAAYRLSGHGGLAMAHRRTALALRARDAPLPARAAHLEHAMLGPDEESGAELRSAAAQVLADAPASAARWLALAHRIAPSTDPYADAVSLGRALLLAGAAERAAAALEPAAGEPGPHQLEALLLSARGARMLGRVDQARGLLAIAARLPRRAGDGPVQLELAILEMQDHQDAEGHARLNALFGSAEIDDPAVRAAATALRCLGFVADGQIRAAAELYPHCHQAFENLTDTGFREVIHAIPALGWCAYFLDHDRDGLVHLDRAIRVSHRYGRSYALAELQTVRAYALAKLGRLDAALIAADEATDAASTFYYPDLLAFAGAIKLRTLLLTAPADTARAQWHTVAALPRPVMRWWRQVVDTTLTETTRPLDLPVPDPGPPPPRPGPLHPTHLARAAHAALSAGDLPTAATLITHAESAARTQYAPAETPAGGTAPADDAVVGTASAGEAVVGTALAGEVVVGTASAVDAVVGAAPVGDAVVGTAPADDGPAGGAVSAGDWSGLGSQIGVAALARAEYSAVIGDLAAADVAATVAIDAFARAGMVVHRAQAELVAGIVAGRRGDFGAATNRFAAARAVFADAGAQRLLAEVTAAQRSLAGSRSPGTATTLTRREREVAELAAQGHTNKDIATHLYLSPRTVEDHLGRVLRKLGLTSRAGIARKLDDLTVGPA